MFRSQNLIFATSHTISKFEVIHHADIFVQKASMSGLCPIMTFKIHTHIYIYIYIYGLRSLNSHNFFLKPGYFDNFTLHTFRS